MALRTFEFPVGTPRPSLRGTAAVIAAVSPVNQLAGFSPDALLAAFLVETYLSTRANALGDISTLSLSADQWFAVLVSSARVAAGGRTGHAPPTGFPGFEPVLDDFATAGVRLEAGKPYDFLSLAESLSQIMPRHRAAGVEDFLRSLMDPSPVPPPSLPVSSSVVP